MNKIQQWLVSLKYKMKLNYSVNLVKIEQFSSDSLKYNATKLFN